MWYFTIHSRHFVGTATEVIQEYSCPVFKGCNICVTGLDSEERNHIKRLASEHGKSAVGVFILIERQFEHKHHRGHYFQFCNRQKDI